MKRCFLILFIFLSACGAPRIHYLYKSDVAFSAAHLRDGSPVGIAVFGDAIPGLYDVIAGDVDLYAGKALNYRDISRDLALSPDRGPVINVERLKEKYPRMAYVMIVWQDEPAVMHHHSKVSEEKEEPYYPYKKKEEEYELYTTYFVVKSEVMLFDVNNESLLAKSLYKFYQVAAYKEKDVFGSHTFFGTVEDILDAGQPGAEESKNFPVIEKVDAANAKGYFFRFLKEYK